MFCVIRKIVFIFAAGNDKSHITMSEINQTINLHVSVDCVLIGFDGEQFRVLLVRQVGIVCDSDGHGFNSHACQ